MGFVVDGEAFRTGDASDDDAVAIAVVDFDLDLIPANGCRLSIFAPLSTFVAE